MKLKKPFLPTALSFFLLGLLSMQARAQPLVTDTAAIQAQFVRSMQAQKIRSLDYYKGVFTLVTSFYLDTIKIRRKIVAEQTFTYTCKNRQNDTMYAYKNDGLMAFKFLKHAGGKNVYKADIDLHGLKYKPNFNPGMMDQKLYYLMVINEIRKRERIGWFREPVHMDF